MTAIEKKGFDKENLKVMDMARFIMSFFVVSLHTLPLFQNEGTFAYKIWWTIAQSTVPVFFIMSGFFLVYNKNTQNLDMGGCIQTTIFKYCKIYALWSLVYLPLAVIYYIQNGFTIMKGVMAYIRDLFYTGQHYNSWILWYILSSIYAFLAIYFVLRIFKDRFLNGTVILSVLSLALYIILHLLSGRNDVIASVRLLNGCIYIPMGMIIGKEKTHVTKRAEIIGILCFVCFTTSIILQYFDTLRVVQDIVIIGIANTTFMLLLCVNVQSPGNTQIYRSMSATIFYLHLYVWTIYYWIVYGEKHFGLDSFIVTSVACLIIAWTVYSIKKKTIVGIKEG